MGVCIKPQIIVTKELAERNHAFLRVLTEQPRKQDISRFLKIFHRLEGKANRELSVILSDAFFFIRHGGNRKDMNPYVQYMYSYPHKTAYRSLSGVSLQNYVHLLQGGGHGLYLHIPFCQAKCGYCNLFSVTGQEEAAIDRYFQAVKRQSMQYQELLCGVQTEFDELVIGGGTPLYLTEHQLEQMFGILEEHFLYAPKREIIIETAPNQTSAAKLAVLKRAGVTRVSMGIQSFHDRELSALGRRHQAKKAREALELLKAADFSCVNVDFIYGIPGQTVESLLESLKEALVFQPDEIFLYPLYVKHGAGLEHQGIVPDGEQAFLQYENASSFLRSAGFRQDSMRRFVRQTKERDYSDCGFGTSLALGCGGRSYLGNLHFCSPYAITRGECLARLAEYEKISDYTQITHGILLSDEELKRRYVIRHLLMMPGLSMDGYQEAFGSQIMSDFPILKDWMDCGFVEIRRQTYTEGMTETKAVRSKTWFVLTQTGLGLSDYLGPQLISSRVRAAMEAWEEEQACT